MISRRTVLVALAIAVTAFVVTHFLPIPGSVHEVLRATGGQLILDLKPSYSAEEVYERLMAFGDNGRAMYRRMMLSTDVIFPLSVLGFLALLAGYSAQKVALPMALRWLLLALPVAYFLSDMIENVSIFTMLSDFPERHKFLGDNLGYVTVFKRITQAAAVLLPTAVLILNGATPTDRSSHSQTRKAG
jgi:hypothetical protein